MVMLRENFIDAMTMVLTHMQENDSDGTIFYAGVKEVLEAAEKGEIIIIAANSKEQIYDTRTTN